MFNTLYEKRDELTAEWQVKFNSLEKDANGEVKATSDDLNFLGGIRNELETIGEQIATLEYGVKIGKDGKWQKVATDAPVRQEAKSLGEQFVSNPEWKGSSSLTQGGRRYEYDMDAKAVMTTTAGYVPEVFRDGTNVYAISRPPQLMDFLQFESTDQNSIAYMAQTTRTANVTAVAEGATLTEAAYAWTEQTAPIRDIGSFLPVTQNQLDDAAQVRSIIDGDLLLATRQEMDRQLTVGSGSGSNLTGIYNTSGILTQAKGALTTLDAIATCLRRLSASEAYVNPNLIVMHATDLWNLLLVKDSQNRYLLADPGGMPKPMAWGRPVIQSDALTAGNALILDTTFFTPVLRRGVVVETGWQNDDFVKRQVTLRAYVRLGIKAKRATAAVTLTGL
jgi:HK97 family phage major capsid protein